jgi:uncharacterized protein YicC (UPF0701 family)
MSNAILSNERTKEAHIMPTLEAAQAIDSQMGVVQSAWKRIGACLEKERDRIREEIRRTPPPIPACDLQFNHLLEQRARIGEELDRLQQAAKQSVTARESIRRIEAFLDSSTFVDEGAKRAIRSGLTGVGQNLVRH